MLRFLIFRSVHTEDFLGAKIGQVFLALHLQGIFARIVIKQNACEIFISRAFFCFLEVCMAKTRGFRIRPQQFSLMLSEDEMTTLKEQAKLLGTKPSYLLRDYIINLNQQRKVS